MASTSSTISILPFMSPHSTNHPLPLPLSLSFPFSHSNPPITARLVLRRAAKPRNGAVKKRQNTGGGGGGGSVRGGEFKAMTYVGDIDFMKEEDEEEDEDEDDEDVESESSKVGSRYRQMVLPKPPAGFVVDADGRVVMASMKRLVTLVDPKSNRPLDCVIRRVFRSSRGDECILVCPADMPVSLLKSTKVDQWSDVSDDEIEAVLPAAAYTLAKTNMHLVHSGFCYTARGGFCYSLDDVFDLGARKDDDEDTEAIEVACFQQDGVNYIIYTPVNPLTFIAVKDKSGTYQIANNALLEDPATISAMDEETRFNSVVQDEEAARFESMLGTLL